MTNSTPFRSKFNWLLGSAMASVLLLTACAGGAQVKEARARQEKAIAIWEEHCKTAGEFIHKTVDNVEGIYLIKARPSGSNYVEQYKLNDPYGEDFTIPGAYVESFLKGSYEAGHSFHKDSDGRHLGYSFVEAKDQQTGQRYRYTGRLEEPWQTNKHYLKGYMRFVTDKVPASGNAPRYGVTYDDISTHEDRDYWIAGSSLKVVDLKTNEVIAERIGYMVDWTQGASAGVRSPWETAIDAACPAFPMRPGTRYQAGQTDTFVEKVLRPAP